MNDDITTEQLRAYRSRTEWGALVRHEICDRAADTIERLTRERDEARRSALEADDAGRSVMSALVKQIEETKHARNQRDDARAAALRSVAEIAEAHITDARDSEYHKGANAAFRLICGRVASMIDKQAPDNG